MLRLDAEWPEGDDVPWCSGFMNCVAWLLPLTHVVRLIRSASRGSLEPGLGISAAVLVAYAAAFTPPAIILMRRKLVR